MSNKLAKKTLLLLVAVTLFGCNEEANEAKKLGFSSVVEMKEAQTKGWHTQKKYYEDNPSIAQAAAINFAKANQTEEKNNELSKKNNQEIHVMLESKGDKYANICIFYFEISNLTNLNFTNLGFDLVTRDSSNIIVDKTDLIQLRIKPNDSITAKLPINHCDDVATIEISNIRNFIQIDGDSISKGKLQYVQSLPILSLSNVPNITMKSKGGVLSSSQRSKFTNSDNGNNNKAYSRNLLEDSIDPKFGSRIKFSKFIDEGGLNTQSTFYGLNIKSLQGQWTSSGTPKVIVMRISGATSPKSIRTALNKVCNSNHDDWHISDVVNKNGNVTNGQLNCAYISDDYGFEISYSIN